MRVVAATVVVAMEKEKTNNMEFERRQSIRVHPEKMLSATFTCGDASVQGRIYNISARGLSIEYEATCSVTVGKDIPIFLSAAMGEAAREVTIKCKPVYDIPTLAHDRNFSGMKMRQCGMLCQKTSPDQRVHLNRLLAWLAV